MFSQPRVTCIYVCMWMEIYVQHITCLCVLGYIYLWRENIYVCGRRYMYMGENVCAAFHMLVYVVVYICMWGERGDGRNPKRGTNSLELVYLSDPGVLQNQGPTKIFLSSKMMNYQSQHIQKREIVDIQKFEYNSNLKKAP